MAIAIKAIPTLDGEVAFRFREEMERNEKLYDTMPRRDRDSDPFVVSMREMLHRSGF